MSAPATPGLLAIGYVRVSSEQQAGEKQTSLADQRAAITALAGRLGVVVAEWFEDAGFSGATVAKRPALLALLAHCEACPQPRTAPGYVLVLNDSRFGRFTDPDEAAALRFRLKAHGWIVRFCEADDVQDPSMRHVMRAIGGAQASEYRRNLRANSIRGVQGTIRQGYWANREPFGYRRAVVFPAAQARVLKRGVPKAKGEKIKLVPGPESEVAIVREIFDRYVLQGQSMRAIVRWLNTVPEACLGRQPWAGPTLRGVLENAAYVGDIAARRRTAERMEAGQYGRTAPEFVVPDAHPALISRELFARAQAILAGIPARGDVHDYRVRGLVHCAECGEPFVGGGIGGNHRKGEPARIRFYVDKGAREKRCPSPTITSVAAHRLEEAVITGLAEHLTEQLHPEQIAQAMQKRLGAGARAKRPDVAKQRADLTRRRDRLVAAIAAGTMLPEEAADLLTKIRADLAALERVPSPEVERQQATATLQQLQAAAQNFPAIARAATGAELRTLLYPWVERMTFTRHTRELTMQLRPLSSVLVPQPLRAGGSRKQDRKLITKRLVVSPASAVTAARREASA